MSHQYQYQSPWTCPTSTLDAALIGGGSEGAQTTSLHIAWPRRISKGPGPPCPQGGFAGLCHHPAEMSPHPCSRTKCSHIHTTCSQLCALTACSQPSAHSTSSPSFLAHTCSIPSTPTFHICTSMNWVRPDPWFGRSWRLATRARIQNRARIEPCQEPVREEEQGGSWEAAAGPENP